MQVGMSVHTLLAKHQQARELSFGKEFDLVDFVQSAL